jgi:1-deoxy-D-xylulose-5-phosphate reductoisomerase
VQFCDGSALAQMGQPDMRVPIQFALSYPERWPNEVPRMDLPARQELSFARPNVAHFPCLRLAREAGEVGGSYPAVLSGADEVAVQAFLAGRLRFTEIPRVLERTLEAHEHFPLTTVAEVQQAEAWGRREAERLLNGC